MIRRCNPRHILSGFKGLIPTTEPNHIRGLRGKKKQWLCTVAGFDLYKVDGPFVRTQWADFLGGHGFVYRFIPKKELWIDGAIKEWPGYIASHELLEALLMSLLGWKYDRAHEAANELEQELRGRFDHTSASQHGLTEVWRYHLAHHFPNGRDTGAVADNIGRQLWKFV